MTRRTVHIIRRDSSRPWGCVGWLVAIILLPPALFCLWLLALGVIAGLS